MSNNQIDCYYYFVKLVFKSLSLRGISRTADYEAIFFAWNIKIASPTARAGSQ